MRRSGNKPLHVCVLQPDYSGSVVEYRHHDPRRNLDALLPGASVDYLFLDKRTVYRQLREAARKGYDIFINLCQGYLDWDIPSIDVIFALESLELPFTGPRARLYDPSKPLMKYVAHAQGVRTPAFRELSSVDHLDVAGLRFPLFVKPAHMGDSLGIDEGSRVIDAEALARQCELVIREFGKALVEEYVPGREFTVLVMADPDDRFRPVALRPLEFLFKGRERFKTYALKITQHLPESNVPVEDPALDARLRDAARRIFLGFSGESYARMDFRMDEAGEIFFLEANFACCVFYPEGHQGAADYILKFDPMGPGGFLERLITLGMERHRRHRRRYERRGNGRSGFGIFAGEPIHRGETVFAGEERAQRLATLSHLESTWPAEDLAMAKEYMYPVSEEVFLLWDEDPEQWAPQNHSCEPNTGYRGLDVVALKDIDAGEELTLDYAEIYDEVFPPFECHCGAASCRGIVRGTPGNSITARERARLAARSARAGGSTAPG